MEPTQDMYENLERTCRRCRSIINGEASVAVQDFVSDRPPLRLKLLQKMYHVLSLYLQVTSSASLSFSSYSHSHLKCLWNARSVNTKTLDVPVSSWNGVGHCTGELRAVLPWFQDVRIPRRVSRDKSSHNGTDESEISSFPASLRDKRSSKYIQISRAWNGHKLWSKRIQKVEENGQKLFWRGTSETYCTSTPPLWNFFTSFLFSLD